MKSILFALAYSFSFYAFAQTAPLKIQAQYVIPAIEGIESAETLRSFPVTYWIVRNSDGTDSALFTLPRELTGKKISTELTVISQSTTDGMVHKILEGPLGRAECTGPWKKMQCQYKFKNLNIKESDVHEFLAKKFGEGTPKFKELKDIVKVFQCDPIGELQTEVKPLGLAPVQNCAGSRQ